MPIFDDPRTAWGARPPRDKSDLLYVAPTRRTEFMNHWNGPPTRLTSASSHARCLAVIKADQDFHMDGRGWNDIGYNGAICPHARAIECRGIDYAGAHCPDHNTTAYGWQFMVGKGELATPAMLARMARAYANCTARSGHKLRALGHRDGYATECPGQQILTWTHNGMPAPTTPKEWWQMAIPKSDLDAIAARIWTHGGADGMTIWRTEVSAYAQIKTLTTAVQALAEAKGADAAAITAAVVDKINKLELTITAGEAS